MTKLKKWIFPLKKITGTAFILKSLFDRKKNLLLIIFYGLNKKKGVRENNW